MSPPAMAADYAADGGAPPDRRLDGDLAALGDFAERLTQVKPGLPSRIQADPADVEQGLAKLVLTLVELLRRLLEKQAIRRIEAGSLSDEEIERMGDTFLKLDRKMTELKEVFGLRDDDLNLNLGPLGDLM
ncbi:MAG TPA: gas vesicle protein K [Ktedonobacterales bacterium]